MSFTTGCHRCGRELGSTELGRQDVCPSCGADTRVCRNCRHWDRSANNECREEQAGRQVEKEKSNFCEWFQAREGGGGAQAPAKDHLKSAADALFGGKKAASPTTDAKSAAEALFKKNK